MVPCVHCVIDGLLSTSQYCAVYGEGMVDVRHHPMICNFYAPFSQLLVIARAHGGHDVVFLGDASSIHPSTTTRPSVISLSLSLDVAVT